MRSSACSAGDKLAGKDDAEILLAATLLWQLHSKKVKEKGQQSSTWGASRGRTPSYNAVSSKTLCCLCCIEINWPFHMEKIFFFLQRRDPHYEVVQAFLSLLKKTNPLASIYCKDCCCLLALFCLLSCFLCCLSSIIKVFQDMSGHVCYLCGAVCTRC